MANELMMVLSFHFSLYLVVVVSYRTQDFAHAKQTLYH